MIFAKVYTKVSKIFQNKNYVQKGLRYGFGLILVSSVPFTLAMFLLINLPVGLIASWFITDVIALLISGIAIAKIMDKF